MQSIEALLVLTLLFPGLLVVKCLKSGRGILDVGVVMGVLLIFLYVLVPGLALLEKREVNRLVTDSQIIFFLQLCLASVFVLVVGLWPGRIGKSAGELVRNLATIRNLAYGVGFVAMSSYFLLVIAAGGFGKVYGQAYGLAWSQSGYVREAVLLSITSAGLIIHYMRLMPSRSARLRSLVLLSLFLSPLLLHGILGARRGIIFMYFVAQYVAIVSSGLIRPRFTTTFALGLFVGLLMLAAVSNRSSFYLGGSWELENSPLKILEVRSGNEFIFGTALTHWADKNDRHYNGARVIAIAFIRPIPSAIWPTKYDDIAAWFDVPNFRREGLFVSDDDFQRTMRWRPESGAAPGMVADMYLEFGWYLLPVLYLLGRLFRYVSDKARQSSGSLFVPLDLVIICLSVYFVMQSIEAFLFRVLFLGLPIAGLYWLFVNRKRRGIPLLLRQQMAEQSGESA